MTLLCWDRWNGDDTIPTMDEWVRGLKWTMSFMHLWSRKGLFGDALRWSFEDIKTMLSIIDKV